MSISPAKGVEPIPGYCLVDKLGDGGFGEVWKVTAPGGLFKALKIIYGNLSGPRAEQELKALERVKAVRHPFLLSLERFEVVQDRLLVVTELADRSLFDRFTECREAGLRGIPREELLSYLRDAADALDHLSDAHGLQHLDIKPQNLLLVSGRIKVADFGLVKNLLGSSASITGGVTPVYAAPEVFDGRVSRHCDQYSLAVAYQELLTGVRPFPGSTALQLAVQHGSAQPFLGALPARDQLVVARALSKAPEQRFASCREMVGLLSGPTTAAAPASTVTEEAVPPPPSDDLPREPTAPFTQVPGPPVAARLAAETPCTSPWKTPPARATDPRGLRPTLFVGIGGTAGTTLRLLRRRLRYRLGSAAPLPIFQMLLLDTDRAALRTAQQGGADEALTPDETLLCPLQPPDYYRDQARALLRWLDRRWLHNIPRSLRPEGVRPLGRLALLDNFPTVLDRLRLALSRLADPSARAEVVGATGRPLRHEAPRVYLVASVAGGTGGGMLWDLAYAVRQVLGQVGLPDSGLWGMLLYGTASGPEEQYRARVNTCATLLELAHWYRPDVAFPGAPEQGLAASAPGRPPFDECYVAHLGDGLGADDSAAAADRVAEYLCLDATAAGALLDRLRDDSRRPGSLRTFGLAGAEFARGALVERASLLLGRRLVSRFLGEAGEGDRGRLEQESDRLLAELGLGLEPLLDRMGQTLGDFLEGEPGLALAPITTGDARGVPDGEGRARILREVEAVLGPESEAGSGPGTAEQAVGEIARRAGEHLGRILVEWLVDKVEAAEDRLGAAECGLRQITRHLRQEADNGRDRLTKCAFYCDDLRRQLLEGSSVEKSGVRRWIDLGLLRPSSSRYRVERLLRTYVNLRQEKIVLEGALAVLEGAAAHLAPFHDLKVCRERVTQFADLFADGPAEGEPKAAGLIPLVPFGAEGWAAAAEALVDQLAPDAVRGLEAQFQAEVLDPRGGLWGVVGNPTEGLTAGPAGPPPTVGFWDLSGPGRDLAAELREQLLVRARPVVRRALESVDPTRIFLERYGNPESAPRAVLTCADQARPRLSQATSWDYAVLALPAGPSGEALRDVATRTLADIPLAAVEGYEGVVFVQETAGLSVAGVTAALCGSDPACAELAARVRTRADVDWAGTSEQLAG
jgi:hypothetical protein